MFSSNACEFRKKGSNELIVRVTMAENNMYSLELNNIDYCALVSDLNKSLWLWHQRYGHLNYNRLKLLNQKNMVDGLLACTDDVCEGCVLG